MARWRRLAPAGTRIPAGDLARWLGSLLRPAPGSRALEEAFGRYLDTEFAVSASSGRALMAIVLETLSELRPDAREVILPGYTCPSVAGSAVAAGLRVRPVDVDPETLDFLEPALESVVTDQALCIVSGNLFGLPNDLPRLEAFARRRGIFLIDDAAQALGARVNNRPVGGFGDVGLFSMDKGKVITTVEGGIAMTGDPEVGALMAQRIANLPEPGRIHEAVVSLKLLGYAALLQPLLYRIPAHLLPLGATPWDPAPRRDRYPGVMAPLGLRLLDQVETLNEERRKIRNHLLDRLDKSQPSAGLTPLRAGARGDVCTAPIRLPLLARDAEHRTRVLETLSGAGLGASPMYPRAIMDIPEVQPHLAAGVTDTPNARQVARTLLTLPTHGWVGSTDLQEIERQLSSLL